MHHTNNTTTKIKMKPVKRKRKYIPKMKCVVEGCKALSAEAMELAKMVNIVFAMEGEDILGNAHTMDAIIIYLGANFVPNTTYYWEKELRSHNTGVVDIQQQVNCTLPKQE